MIPKSLHTVTALVNVAAHLRAAAFDPDKSSADWIAYASRVLSYTGTDDVHGLRAKATIQFDKVRS